MTEYAAQTTIINWPLHRGPYLMHLADQIRLRIRGGGGLPINLWGKKKILAKVQWIRAALSNTDHRLKLLGLRVNKQEKVLFKSLGYTFLYVWLWLIFQRTINRCRHLGGKRWEKECKSCLILGKTPHLCFCFDFPWPSSRWSFVENNCFQLILKQRKVSSIIFDSDDDVIFYRRPYRHPTSPFLLAFFGVFLQIFFFFFL